jgi:multicomponent Na+:H+ antiporter subunit B
MVKKTFIFALLIGFGYIFYSLSGNFKEQKELKGIGEYYAENAADEVGAANIVTSIVVTYRGFDTLGEVSILFLASAIIGFVLSTSKNIPNEKDENDVYLASEILVTASKILIPIMFMFGTYVFINGHLTPGGGFQGGSIIASSIVLSVLANPKKKFNHKLIDIIESLSGVGFVVAGILGLILAGGFLDNRIFDLGTFGKLFSAGVIPIIYIFVGMKVGSELTGILLNLKETKNIN